VHDSVIDIHPHIIAAVTQTYPRAPLGFSRTAQSLYPALA
jgi:hypothetical protein